MSAYEIYSPEDDDSAFAAVYRAHSQKLLRYCQYRLHDRHEAEDVVQEAFTRAWRTMPVSGPEQSFYPWLRVVAGNLCTDILRKRSRSEPRAVIDMGSVDGGMDRLAEESDRVLVRQALDRLNQRHRSALMMRESDGMTYDQIAAHTGVTASTVESLLWRARQALKREFTFLAGAEGTLAVVPVVLLLVARGRGAGRRAWIRLVRRFPFLDPSTGGPLAHVTMAAVAALSVVSGLALTLGVGGSRPGAAAVMPSAAAVPAAAEIAAAGQEPAVPSQTAVSARSTPAPPAAWTPSLLVDGPTVTAASRPAYAAPLRVVTPVVTGARAASYAGQFPVALHAGQLTLGVSPPAIASYTDELGHRVAAPVAPVTDSVPKENLP